MAEEQQMEIEVEAPEIEIIDDTPVEDRGKTPKGEVDVSDDEISQYSENVQKRIKDLRRAYHDERRIKDQALREQQEAIAYAKSIAQKNQELQERLARGEKYLVETSKAKNEAMLSSRAGIQRSL